MKTNFKVSRTFTIKSYMCPKIITLLKLPEILIQKGLHSRCFYVLQFSFTKLL